MKPFSLNFWRFTYSRQYARPPPGARDVSQKAQFVVDPGFAETSCSKGLFFHRINDTHVLEMSTTRDVLPEDSLGSPPP